MGLRAVFRRERRRCFFPVSLFERFLSLQFSTASRCSFSRGSFGRAGIAFLTAGACLTALVLVAVSEAHAENSISHLYLIDADAGVRIRELRSGDTLNLFDLPTHNLSIEAEASEDVSKVIFRLNNQHRFRSETSRPFSLVGDTAGKFHSWKPVPGRYLVETTPYVGETPGATARVEFEVVDVPAAGHSAARPAAEMSETGSEELDVVQIQREEADSQPADRPESRAKLSDDAASGRVQPDGVEASARELTAEASMAEAVTATEQEKETGETATTQTDTRAESGAELSNETSVRAGSAPSEPIAEYKLLSETDYPDTRCVGFVSKETEHLTVVCAHRFADIESAQVAINDDGTGAKKICEFLNTQSPMIIDCASSLAIIDGLHRGHLLVALKQRSGDILGIPVRTR